MKAYDAATLARLDAGNVDYLDGVTLVFDSGIVNLVLGGRGQFVWTDAQIGTQTFYGSGSLIDIEVPAIGAGAESEAIRLKLFETYLQENSDVPVNVFDDNVRATIDEEEWEGRQAILSVFWLNEAGSIIEREQVGVREMDSMPLEWDETGNPLRTLVLEEPDIAQRDIEGKTCNAEFQALIDPSDLAFEHVGTIKSAKINWGRVSDETATYR